MRWNFPFKDLESAILYLRVADVTTGSNCGIYEIISCSGRKSYKIFDTSDSGDRACSDKTNIPEDLKIYLKKNPAKSVTSKVPVFTWGDFEVFPGTEVRYLDDNEISKYLAEQK